MNRIYQGRVTKVLPSKKKPQEPTGERPSNPPSSDSENGLKTNGVKTLWQLHSLFQDGVNYYLAAFAAMIADDCRDESLRAFKKSVRDCWSLYSGRQGKWKMPFAKVCHAIGSDCKADFETFAAALFAKTANQAGPERRDAACRYIFKKALLLEIKTNDKKKENLAGEGQEQWKQLKKLCAPKGACETTADDVHAIQAKEAARVAKRVAEGGSLSLDEAYFFKSSPSTESWTAKKTKQELRMRFDKLLAKEADYALEKEAFETWMKSLPADFSLKSPGKKTQASFNPALLLALRPDSAAIRRIFIAKSKAVREGKYSSAVTADEVYAARLSDIPVFPFFTELTCSRDPLNRSTVAPWPDFEKAAFIEVFTKIGQFCVIWRKRKQEEEKLRQEAAKDEARFQGDLRMELLRQVVITLAGDRHDDEGRPIPYRIRPRSLKAWDKLKKKWLESSEKSDLEPKELLLIKKKLQKSQRERFGNAALYEHLALRCNRDIWKKSAYKDQASDPLKAWAEHTERAERLEQLEEDLAFTPAHAKHSPRYFRWRETNDKRHQKWAGGHDSEFVFIESGLDFSVDPPQTAEIEVYYRAPRLIRDGLRHRDEKLNNDEPDAPWLPPVLKSLPEFHGKAKQSFQRVAVRLMAKSESDIQIALEPSLENKEWTEHWNRGHQVDLRWGSVDKNGDKDWRGLKWPEKWPANPNEVPEWSQRGQISCLSVDLGLRTSGAYKVLIARPASGTLSAPERVITPDGYGTQWVCGVEAEGLIRLRGEDAKIYRYPTAREIQKDSRLAEDRMALLTELWGSKGRSPIASETEALETFFAKVDYPMETRWPGWKEKASYPELNDELLRALSRHRGLLYRLHRWGVQLAGDDAQKAACREQIQELPEKHPCKDLQERLSDEPALDHEIKKRSAKLLDDLNEGVELAANRILPSTEGQHRWRKSGDWHEMAFEKGNGVSSKQIPGQRGLSTMRLVQLQLLRQIVQSLNHLCRHEHGKHYCIPPRGEVPDPFPYSLEMMEDVREDRAKQIAHAIFAQALGVEPGPPPADKTERKVSESLHAVYRQIPKRSPVDFIVIEDLSRFTTSDLKSRRENRALAVWSHRRIVDHLEMLCELVGMKVVKVAPDYTSKFCPVTGVPGFRADEVQKDSSEHSWLREKAKEDEDKFIQAFVRQLESMPANGRLLMPREGGSYFVKLCSEGYLREVAASSKPPHCHHADISAAHRIGLRALAHPKMDEFRGKFWANEGAFKEKGRFVLTDPSGMLGGQNYAGYGLPLVFESDSLWERIYKQNAWPHCLAINSARLRKWGFEPPLIWEEAASQEDEIP